MEEKGHNRFIPNETANAGNHVSPETLSLKAITCKIVETESSAAQVNSPLLPHIIFHQAVEEKHKETWDGKDSININNKCVSLKKKNETISISFL